MSELVDLITASQGIEISNYIAKEIQELQQKVSAQHIVDTCEQWPKDKIKREKEKDEDGSSDKEAS